MPASEVSICNQALGWLGADLITSLDDDSTAAQLCKLNYPILRDTVLEEAEWSFAIKRYQLPALADKPVSGWQYAHEVPGDVLRVLTCRADVDRDQAYNEMDWALESGNIMSNTEIVYIRSIVQVTDPAKYSTMFTQALAARIAADLAIPITESRSIQSDMFGLYSNKISEAVTVDGMQGRTTRLQAPSFRRGRAFGNTFPPNV